MIGKTRQMEEHYDPEVGKARGVLRRPVPAGRMKHSRKLPARDVAPWIAHYWSVSWDLRGCPPHVAETLPHPNVHLVFVESGATVSGVQTSKFSTVLEGRSQVFGVKFRPGGFRPFYGEPISKLANRHVDAQRIFGDCVMALGERLRTARKDKDRIQAADEFFLARIPAPDESVQLADRIVDRILNDPAIRTVDELSIRAGVGKRSLQRLFSEYVGASPKWVIRRYRLHETLERLHAGEAVDLADLAVDLGYFDQAHLIKDFKSIVGLTPGQYQALTTSNRNHNGNG